MASHKKSRVREPVGVEGEARKRLHKLRDHLNNKHPSTRATSAGVVAYALQVLEAVELSAGADVTVISKKGLAETLENAKAVANAHIIHAVHFAFKELTGQEVEIRASNDGRYFTLKLGEKSVSLLGEIEKSAFELDALGLALEPEAGHH